MKANKPHHQNNISMMGDLVDWARTGLGGKTSESQKDQGEWRNQVTGLE